MCKHKLEFLDFLFMLNTEQSQFLCLQIERNRDSMWLFACCGLSRTVKIRSRDKTGKENKHPHS